MTRHTRSLLSVAAVMVCGAAAEVSPRASQGLTPLAIVGGGDASSAIAFVDQATNAIVAQVDGGAFNATLAATSDGRRLFVASPAELRMIDVATGATVASTPLTHSSHVWTALSPDDRTLYLTSYTGTVEERDAATLVLKRVLLTGSGGNNPLQVSPDGRHLFVGFRVLSTVTGQVEYESRFNLAYARFLPTGTLAYVHLDSNNYGLVDVDADRALSRVLWPTDGGYVRGWVLSPDARRLFFLMMDRLIAVDAGTGAVVGRLPLDPIQSDFYGSGMAISADGSRLFISEGYTNRLHIIDASDLTLITRMEIPSRYSDVLAAPARPLAGFHVEQAATAYRRPVVLASRLLSGGHGAASKLVAFRLLGQPAGEALTDASGIARITVDPGALPVGTYPSAVEASFAGDAETPPASGTQELRIYRATPAVSWEPGAILAGEPLGAQQLNATADVAGRFIYSPAAGTPLPLGSHDLFVEFVPDDTANYDGARAYRRLTAHYFTAASHPSVRDSMAGHGVAIDPLHNRVYVRQNLGITVIDASSHAQLARLPLSTFAFAIAIDLDHRRLLITTADPQPTLRIHDADSLAEIERVPLPEGVSLNNAPGALAFDGTTGLAWIADWTGTSVVAVDLNSDAAAERIRSFPTCGMSVAVNPRTGYVYAACLLGGLTAIDGDPTRPSFGQAVASVPTREGYTDVAVNTHRNEIFVIDPADPWAADAHHRVLVIDGDPSGAAFHDVLGSLDLSMQPGLFPAAFIPFGIAVNPVSGRVYVRSSDRAGDVSGETTLSVFDANRSLLSVTVMPEEQSYSMGSVAINPVTNRIYVSASYVTAVDETVIEHIATPGTQGAPVTVEMTAVRLTFTEVTTAGVTSATALDPMAAALTLPGQFSIEGAPAYEISTTADWTGPITLCFATAIDDPDVFASLVILHGVNGAWVPEVTSRDFATGELCATVSSLSPFVLGTLEATYGVRTLHDSARAAKRGSTMPLKLQLLDAGGGNVSAAALTVRATRLVKLGSGTTFEVQDPGQANADSNFRFDATLNGYIYNVKTTALTPGTYEMRLRAAGDPATHAVRFQVR